MAARTGKTQPEDLSPVIAQMRQIAAEAGDHLLLGDGPPHPDHELLEACGEALHRLCEVRRLRKEDQAMFLRDDFNVGDNATMFRARSSVLCAQATLNSDAAVQLMRRAKKLRATTPAGIYAKALLVRASATGANVLAMSLAGELVDCASLRESLWPGQAGEAR